MSWYSSFTFEDPCGCTVLDMQESRKTGGQSSHHKRLSSLMIWSVEELETLRPQNQGYQTIDRQEERGAQRESARRSFFKRRERAFVNQPNTGTVPKTTLGKLLRNGVKRILAVPSAYTSSWTELVRWKPFPFFWPPPTLCLVGGLSV